MMNRSFCLAVLTCLATGLGAGEAALPDGYDTNSPVFRGPLGCGLHRVEGVPTEWNEKEGKNILWKAKVPMGGLSSPLVWGDQVFVAGATREKRELYCYGLADGQLRWTGTYASHPDASTEYPVWKNLDAVMHAAATPATNGKQVFAIYANGEIAAWDLAGTSLWSKFIGATDDNVYGLTGSLLVYQDSVIVQFDGAESNLIRLKGADGEEVYNVERDDCTWASPILVRAGGACRVITNGAGETACWDPDDGKKLWDAALVDGDIAPSPVIAVDKVVVNMKDNGIYAVNLADGEEAWSIEELEEGEISDAKSMCTDGTYVYQFYGDVLVCIEAATGKKIYEKAVDASASYASPFVAGDKLYLVGGDTVLVGSTGPEFEVVATNQLDDYTNVSPTVVAGKILIRSEQHLYCLGVR